MRILAMLLLITALLAGCGGAGSGSGGQSATLPSREPFVVGEITKIEGGRVLVEADPTKQEGTKCWFALVDGTVVAREQDGKAIKAEPGALKTGLRVKAWEDGAVLESYPCQTGAKAILITAAQ